MSEMNPYNMPETENVPETPDTTEISTETTKSNIGFRLLGALVLIISILALVIIPYAALPIPDDATANNARTFLQMSQDVFKTKRQIFGLLPAYPVGAPRGTVYGLTYYVFAIGLALCAVFSILSIIFKKRAPAFVRIALISLCVGALAYTAGYFVAAPVVDAKACDLMSLIVTVIALVLVILSLVFKKKEEPEEEVIPSIPVASSPETANGGFYTEKYAESYAYEGGPVAGVVMAEEVNPSFLPQGPHVNTAGYDFYNCKSFDPFIATLDMEERNEFTELFILRFKGEMPEIPSYEVGGKNSDFFRMIFIYLGKYRDRISNKLLNKIYQYSAKIS